MENIITTWTYQKGELTEKRIINISVYAMAVIGFIGFLYFFSKLSTVGGWSITLFSYTKIGGWFLVIPFSLYIILLLVISFFIKSIIFSIYKKMFSIKEEKISFTANKIISDKKEWILKDDKRMLKSVTIKYPDKDSEIHFDGTKQKGKKEFETYKYYFPIPENEMENAKKIEKYFEFLNKTEK